MSRIAVVVSVVVGCALLGCPKPRKRVDDEQAADCGLPAEISGDGPTIIDDEDERRYSAHYTKDDELSYRLAMTVKAMLALPLEQRGCLETIVAELWARSCANRNLPTALDMNALRALAGLPVTSLSCNTAFLQCGGAFDRSPVLRRHGSTWTREP
jgi:hypothetical protein